MDCFEVRHLFVRDVALHESVVVPSGRRVRLHVSADVRYIAEFLCDVLKVDDSPWAHFLHETAQGDERHRGL